ncbi:MAG: sodium/dicarboxylate symporter family protein [Firmicutes bacterium]|nr:sodium/dicarboxylate symporter family protein [Bacillota bacterium]
MVKIIKNQTFQILLALIAGLALGLLIGPPIAPIKVIGDVFLRLIQMSVVALVCGSVIESLGNLESKEIGKLGGKIFVLFTAVTIIAAFFGIASAQLINPGIGINMALTKSLAQTSNQTVSDMILGFFPSNIFKALSEGNMVQSIIFAIPVGIVLSIVRSKNPEERILPLVQDVNKVLVGVIKMIMKIAPIGIFALLAWVAGTVGVSVIMPLAKFLLAFGVASFLYLVLFVVLTAAYAKVNPILLWRKMITMSIVAFTTTSSAVTLPIQMDDCVNKLGVSQRISNLVNPLGMILNSNGLSMYLALAAVTLLQFYGMEASYGEIAKIVVISTLACLGTVVVPGGGLVALTIVVPVIGLPIESIALLAGIDWFSGMFRTVLNVDGDALVALAVAASEKEIDYSILNQYKEEN